MPSHQVIHIRSDAPSKPVAGAACNGCGLCCIAEPCPLGVLISLSRKGPCRAVQWSERLGQYRCGALSGLPHAKEAAAWSLPVIAAHTLARLRNGLVKRWIAAGVGCDCALEPAASRTMERDPQPEPESYHDD